MDFLRNIISSFHKPECAVKEQKVTNVDFEGNINDKVTNADNDLLNKNNSLKKNAEEAKECTVLINSNALENLAAIKVLENVLKTDDNNNIESTNTIRISEPLTDRTNAKNLELSYVIESCSKTAIVENEIRLEYVPVDKVSDKTNAEVTNRDGLQINSIENSLDITTLEKVVSCNTIDEIATKYLNEFDEVLDKLKGDAFSVEKVTLDEINEVIPDLEEFKDTDNLRERLTQYFNSNINLEILAKEELPISIDVISISSDETNAYDTKSKDNKEKTDLNNNFDVISISSSNDSSDDITLAEFKLKYAGIKDDTKLYMKENLDRKTVYISTTDDSDYHSSDFEFITEEEAKMDGLIMNIDSERHLANPVAGPSRLDDERRVPEGDEFYKLFEGRNQPSLSEIRFLENKSLLTRTPMFIQYEGVGFQMHMNEDSSDDEYREEAKETLNKIYQLYPENRWARRRDMAKRRRRF